jgi:hypothetical protein
MSLKKLIPTTLAVFLLISVTAFAGTESGGGGDASEERVNEIRSDLLSWIKSGGAKGLVLPTELTYEEYYSEMKDLLQPQKVVIGFVESEVNVNGVAKTCRGYLSKTDSRQHIICNIGRFANTSEADQYKLIHHEFAGLAGLEKNDGAASDYNLSAQITDFLTRQTVLRLAVKRKAISSSLKKLFTVEFDTDGKQSAFLIDENIFRVLNTYIEAMTNHTEGFPSTYPQFTPAEQAVILFNSDFPNLISLTNETNRQETSDEPLCNESSCLVSLMTVRKEGDHLAKSFYANAVIFKAMTSYFKSMLDNKENTIDNTFPALTPAQHTMMQLMSSLIQDVLKSTKTNDKSINASRAVNDSLNEYFKGLVNTEEVIKSGEPETFPQFTPAEQTKITMFLSLVGQNLK